ncbi:secreted RxLR effector protein 161-like [Apium graveolens]|uniref:secreted RxLR effector protein 161-like n=1 Tax=Apium graveolens TaxID=4045 RepID=UPI003D7B3D09
MLIFGTHQNQVDKTKKFLSSNFDMKDLGEAEVILVSTPIDPSLKLVSSKGVVVSQLEFSRAIGSLMYAMISTRPDIAYVVGKLSRFTSKPSSHHWQALSRMFKYLKGTMDYGLTYTGFPSILEGHSDASWICDKEDHSSTSGWVFLLGGGAISWA